MEQRVDHSTNSDSIIISPQFCYPHPIEITVARKFLSLTNNRYEVTDVNGNIIFTIPLHRFISPYTRKILDSSGKTVVTCCAKKSSRHNRWQVFRGESTDQGDLVFRTSAELPSFMHPTNKIRVYLAVNNMTQDDDQVCDYSVKGKKGSSSYGEVYAGEPSTAAVIAQFYKKIALSGRDKYVVTVNPNVDYLFIVSLVLIFDEIM